MTTPDAVTTYPPIPPEDLERLHADDRRAGGTIVIVMTAIFTLGLLLYSVILFNVL